MHLGALLEKIAGHQHERDQARQDDFRGIVAQIADGKEPDAELVDRVLREAGKSLDDLRKAAELLHKRRTLYEQVARMPKLAAEREEVQAKLAVANQALKQAEKQHDETTAPLRARLWEIKEATWAGASARARPPGS